MTQIINTLLNSLLPVGLAAKGLGKINPMLENFFSGALAAGYTADQAIKYLRDQNPEMQRLAQGATRSDEMAALKRYEQGEEIPDALRRSAVLGAGAIGGGLAAGARAAGGAISPTQILPPNPQPPQIAGPAGRPQLPPPRGPTPAAARAALPGAAQPAFGVTQANQAPPAQPTPIMAQAQAQPKKGKGKKGLPPPTDPFDFINRFDPDLASFISQSLNQGQPPQAAGALAKMSGYFDKPIKKIEGHTKMNFVDLVSQLLGAPQGMARAQQMNLPFGEGQQAQPQARTSNRDARLQQMQAMIEQLRQIRGG